MNKKIWAWSLLGLSIVLSSCYTGDIQLDKIKVADLSPNIAAKLGSTTFTVEEFIADLDNDQFAIDEDENMLISFVYTEEFVFDGSEEIIEASSISNTASFSFERDIPGLPISQTIPFDDEFNFEYETPNNEIIDSVFYKSGTLVYDMVSSYPASIDYNWTILDMKELISNNDLSRDNFLPYEGATLAETVRENLVKYKSIVRRDEEGDNTFDVLVGGDLIVAPNVDLLASQSIDFELTFEDPVFNAIFGEFGSDPIILDDISFDLDFLNDFRSEIEDVIYFADPSITFEIDNSFGVELGLDFTDLNGVATDGTVTNLETTLTDEDMLIRAPQNTQVGESVITTIRLDSDNSSIDELLSALPERILFPIEAIPNPEISNLDKNFLTDSSAINVKTVIELPLNIRMNSYSNEFDTELSELDLDEIVSIEVIANISNNLPFNGEVNVEFLDEAGNSLYIIEDGINFNSPEIDADGRTVGVDSTESRVELSAETFEIIENAKSIRSTVTLSSEGVETNANVKIFSDYAMTLDLGIIGEVIIEL